MQRKALWVAAAVAISLLTSGCDVWTMSGAGPHRLAANDGETKITTANVTALREQFRKTIPSNNGNTSVESSDPVAAGDFVFVNAVVGSTTTLFAFDATGGGCGGIGNQCWSKPLGPYPAFLAPVPAPAAGNVGTNGATANVVFATNGNKVFAFNANNGSPRFTGPGTSGGAITLPNSDTTSIIGSPALAPVKFGDANVPMLFVSGMLGHVYGIDTGTSGLIISQFDVAGSLLYSGPAVSGNTLVVGDDKGDLWAFPANAFGSASALWRNKDAGTALTTPAIDPQRNLVLAPTAGGHLRGVRLSDGATMWIAKKSGTAIHMGSRNVAVSKGKVYFVSANGDLRIVDEANGNQLAQTANAGVGGVSIANGVVFTGNTLKAYRADTGALIGNVDGGALMMGGSQAAIANGKVYVTAAIGSLGRVVSLIP